MIRTFPLLLLVIPAFAQSGTSTMTPSVQAQGSASIPVQPDQAQLTVSISTNGTTAQDAGQQNANLAQVVIAALTKLIGAKGTLATVSYNVSPRYSNATATQPPAIVGYTATLSELLTLNDTTLIGQAIDTANQAGATGVGSLTLGLQNPEPSMEAALSAAAKQALAARLVDRQWTGRQNWPGHLGAASHGLYAHTRSQQRRGGLHGRSDGPDIRFGYRDRYKATDLGRQTE